MYIQIEFLCGIMQNIIEKEIFWFWMDQRLTVCAEVILLERTFEIPKSPILRTVLFLLSMMF